MGLHAIHPPISVTAFLLSVAGQIQGKIGERCLAYGMLLVPRARHGNGEHSVSLAPAFLLPAYNRACCLPPSLHSAILP